MVAKGDKNSPIFWTTGESLNYFIGRFEPRDRLHMRRSGYHSSDPLFLKMWECLLHSSYKYARSSSWQFHSFTGGGMPNESLVNAFFLPLRVGLRLLNKKLK